MLEGGEGAGKSTAAAFLKEQLPREQFLFTREPGGTPFAEKVRALMIAPEATGASAEALFTLVWAGRFDHVKNVIKPSLERGTHVISERFDSSTFAYQIRGQETPALEKLFWECRALLGECIPDLYIWLDVSPEEGLHRMRENTRKAEPIDQFEARELAFHTRVRAGLTEFFANVPVVKIDAGRPLGVVQQDVLSHVKMVT